MKKQYISYAHIAFGCTLLAGQVVMHAQEQQQANNLLSSAINSAVRYGPAVAALGSALFTPQQTQAQQNGGLWNLLFGGNQQQQVQQPQNNQTVADILPMLFGKPQEHQKAQTHAQTTLPKFFQKIADQPHTKELSEEQMRSIFNQSRQMTERIFKSMGLPIPQLSDEQKEQMFQFSKRIFEQNKDLFTPTEGSQQSGNSFLKGLLGAANKN